MESNRLQYSDNYYRLLGCEPKSFEPTIENFYKFVHPDDRNSIIETTKQNIEEKKISNPFYRIIRKDGQLRYFKTISKFTDYGGKTIVIGINIDVTKQHLSNLSLEERNRELEQSNKELASFNHIASHDLQEPLRKIQTFISRLTEKEASTLSETGKEYFIKIKTSAGRMRKLIDDLLLFSRTTRIEKNFMTADLNVLFENAKQELAQIIEEKNANVRSVHLPVLNVIPFQIQQLFTNLLSNSLKYSKPDIVTIIEVECKKIIAKEDPVLKIDSDKKFYKISVTDNGLGFEQQYAESVFVLFQRLHIDEQHQGSGIGLSICKKIVENHNGYIFAKGNPGIGSVFTFYLPG